MVEDLMNNCNLDSHNLTLVRVQNGGISYTKPTLQVVITAEVIYANLTPGSDGNQTTGTS